MWARGLVGSIKDRAAGSGARPPDREELDQVSSELPVAITHVSGHLMSCNSRCLELAGISAESQDPAGGLIRRKLGSKEPDGVLEETAMYAIRSAMPVPDDVWERLLDMASGSTPV